MIQRGYIILIAGGVLFAIGIALAAIWGIQFAEVFLQDNTLVSEVPIDPGQSTTTTRSVTDVSRPLTIAINIRGVEDNDPSLRSDTKLVANVQDPSGNIISRNEFSGNLFTSFEPEQAGNHVLTINNVGTRSVTIDGTFGYMPFVSMADGQQVDFGQLYGVIGGVILTSIGFFTIIAGIVLVVVDNRKQSGSTVTSDDSGITYRKD